MTAQKETPANMDIWSAYFNPPKDATKAFTRGGGFKGTAIDPMWAIRCATELWGPMGDRWGLEIISEEFAPLAEDHVLHISSCRIYYPGPSGERATVPCVGQTWALSTNKGGLSFDDECVKKSRTDALSKGLSWLGIGAGVHMGAFDGNKWASLPENTPAAVSKTDTRVQTQAQATTDNGSLKTVALSVWNSMSDSVCAAAASADEKTAKTFLMGVVRNRGESLGIDPASPSKQDLVTWIQEVSNHISLIADENTEGDN